MSLPAFPISWTQGVTSPIRGITWPVKRIPTFNTIVHKSPSGASIAIPLYVNPLWEFELTYGAIPSGPPPTNDVQILTAFWILVKGPAFPFTFDPGPNVALNVATPLTCRFSVDNGLTLEDFTNTLTSVATLKIEQALIVP